MKRVFLIVLDSVGIGELPDARNYGDELHRLCGKNENGRRCDHRVSGVLCGSGRKPLRDPGPCLFFGGQSFCAETRSLYRQLPQRRSKCRLRQIEQILYPAPDAGGIQSVLELHPRHNTRTGKTGSGRTSNHAGPGAEYGASPQCQSGQSYSGRRSLAVFLL